MQTQAARNPKRLTAAQCSELCALQEMGSLSRLQEWAIKDRKSTRLNSSHQ